MPSNTAATTIALVIAGCALILLLGLLRWIYSKDWIGEFRAVPGRIAWEWETAWRGFGSGLLWAAAAALLFFGGNNYSTGILRWALMIAGGFVGFFAALQFGSAIWDLLFSPFRKTPWEDWDDDGIGAGLETVERQKAYGNARLASETEVDVALRDGEGEDRHRPQFED